MAAAAALSTGSCIEPWLSHLSFGELVAEGGHRVGNTLKGVVVRRAAAALAFVLGDGDGRGIDSRSGENGDRRGESEDRCDCGGEDRSPRWDFKCSEGLHMV